MAQARFRTYQQAIESLEHNHGFHGLLRKGRYAGFNIFTQQTALTFDLGHSAPKAVQHTNLNQSQTNPTGVLYTPQGVTIQENADITAFAIASNAANAFERLDLVICDHEYLDSVGGQAATYAIVQGADGGPVRPALANPEKQTIVGELSIPASEVNLNNATWVEEPTPGLGDTNRAGRDEDNIFTKQQSFGYDSTGAARSLANNRLELNGPGNFFGLVSDDATEGALIRYIVDRPIGTLIGLRQAGTAINTLVAGAGGVPAGYANIDNGLGFSIELSDDAHWVLLLKKNADTWDVIGGNFRDRYLWTQVPLSGTVANHTTHNFEYLFDAKSNVVRLRGATVNSMDIVADLEAGILPVGFRPPTEIRMAIHKEIAGTEEASSIEISAAGAIVVHDGFGVTSPAFFDGIQFTLDA